MIKMQIKRYTRYTGSVRKFLMQPGIFMESNNLNGLMNLIVSFKYMNLFTENVGLSTESLRFI